MKSNDTKALIHHPGTAITPGQSKGTSPVIARITQDVLTRARSAQRELSQARFRIGEYELREPDYRQILDWAENVGMEPEDVLAVLVGSVWEDYREEFEPIRFQSTSRRCRG